MSNSKTIRALVLSAAVCGFSLWASPAQAGAYYSWSSPLTAWEDGDAQAQGYGYMSVKNSTWLHNSTHHRDPRPGGNGAFHVTDYNLEVYNSSEGWHWMNWFGEDESARTTDWRWYDQQDYRDYTMYDANRGRIRAKVCEDQPHSPDPCSTRPYQTFGL
jgi:hypothetical protein